MPMGCDKMFKWIGTKTLYKPFYPKLTLYYGGTLYTIRDDDKKLNVDILINRNQVSFNAEYDSGRQFIKDLYKRVFLFNNHNHKCHNDVLGIQTELLWTPYQLPQSKRIFKFLNSIPFDMMYQFMTIAGGI